MNIYGIVLIVLALSSFVYIKIAKYFNITDQPNHRSSHTVATIRGGGILFLIAVLLFFFLNDFQYPYFVLGVLIIGIVSFIDDIRTLSSKVRLPFQFLAIFLILLQVGVGFNPIWLWVVLLVIGVGFINVYNFMDGINGITGLYGLVVLGGLYFINREVQIVNEELLIYSVLSLLVFGYSNFRKKAVLFAGDIGSISIAMVIFFIGVSLVKETGAPLILLLSVVYGADSMLTLVYRKFIGESITEPHRHHIYQKLVDVLGWGHLKVSIVYAGVQLVLNVLICKTYTLALSSQYLLFFIIVPVFIAGYMVLFRYIETEKIKRSHAQG